MFKVGQKVVCVETLEFGVLTVGKVYTVVDLWALGIWVVDDVGKSVGIRFQCFKPHAETEAEKRGAKFGVNGVVKDTGDRCVYLDESLVLPGHWEIAVKGKAEHWHRKPSEIRLDHEPEYVAWSEAPEHLKYDASRVYCDGNPVKWIAKPEGAWSEVAYVDCDRVVRGSPDALTVKL